MSDRAQKRADWWIPWVFVGGFLVVLTANVILVVFAATSWTGLETDDAYRKGVSYNVALAAARAQDQLGWQSSIVLTAGAGERAVLEVSLADKNGAPLYGAKVSALFVRPTHTGSDLTVEMRELERGRYQAEVDLPLAGLWDVKVAARRDGKAFQATQRVVAER